MNRPEVICHMVSTIDGKIAGQSFAEEGLRPYLEFYVQTKQKFETQATVYGASTAKEIFVGKEMEAFARPSQITDDPDYIVNFQRFPTLDAKKLVNAPKMSAHHRGICHF